MAPFVAYIRRQNKRQNKSTWCMDDLCLRSMTSRRRSCPLAKEKRKISKKENPQNAVAYHGGISNPDSVQRRSDQRQTPLIKFPSYKPVPTSTTGLLSSRIPLPTRSTDQESSRYIAAPSGELYREDGWNGMGGWRTGWYG